MNHPLILVSNDDGVHADGIRILAEHLGILGEVWVVAPDRERSASSHAISLHVPLRLRQLGERTFCVDGTPADSVYLGLRHILQRPPDLVVCGINHGANLGNDVIYSGTVSAAMEGALLGHRSIAVSLCMDSGEPQSVSHFETAGEVAVEVARASLERKRLPTGSLLNVNVPNLPRPRLAGMKLSRLGYTAWSKTVDVREDPRGIPYFWIGGERFGQDETPDSDNAAVRAGYVSITPIHYDVTDYRAFGYVRDLPLRDIRTAADGLGAGPLPTYAVDPPSK